MGKESGALRGPLGRLLGFSNLSLLGVLGVWGEGIASWREGFLSDRSDLVIDVVGEGLDMGATSGRLATDSTSGRFMTGSASGRFMTGSISGRFATASFS